MVKSKEVTIFTDAGYDLLGTPPLYCSIVVTDEEGEFHRSRRVNVPPISSCQAEYYGLLFALEEIRGCGYKKALIMNDNQTMVRQMQGSYRVKQDSLKDLYQSACWLWESISESCIVRIKHIPREKNLADKYVQLAKKEGK